MDVPKDVGKILKRLKKSSPSGFAIAFHVQFTTPAFLFQTYPKEWLTVYNQRGLVMQDPIVAWSFANTGAIRWAELADNDPANVLGTAKDYGLAYGVAMGIESQNSRSLAGFSRPDRDFTDAEIKDLQADAVALHELTAEAKIVSPELAAELRRLSVTLTHP